MKILIDGHNSVGYRVPNKLFNAYIATTELAIKLDEDQDSLEAVHAVKRLIELTCSSFEIDYIATGNF